MVRRFHTEPQKDVCPDWMVAVIRLDRTGKRIGLTISPHAGLKSVRRPDYACVIQRVRTGEVLGGEKGSDTQNQKGFWQRTGRIDRIGWLCLRSESYCAMQGRYCGQLEGGNDDRRRNCSGSGEPNVTRAVMARFQLGQMTLMVARHL